MPDCRSRRRSPTHGTRRRSLSAASWRTSSTRSTRARRSPRRAGWAEAHGSEDARLIAGVLDLHRRSGGDLPIVLDGLAGHSGNVERPTGKYGRSRRRLASPALSLLASVGFFAFLLLTSRRETLDAIATPLGGTALGIGLGLEVLAFLWIRHLLEVR